eukprot:1184212-Prorocentrum_minimum.AAC.1
MGVLWKVPHHQSPHACRKVCPQQLCCCRPDNAHASSERAADFTTLFAGLFLPVSGFRIQRNALRL